MALSNKSLNTGTITNKDYSTSGLTWDEAVFTWNEALGTWDNPYTISNKSLNTGTITNKSLS